MSDIIKDKNTTAVKEKRTNINKESVEESQKKAVNKKPSAEKSIKAENADVKPFYRDYAGKIKYNGIKEQAESKSTSDKGIIRSNDNTTVVKNIKNADVVKPVDNKGAFRHNSSVVRENINGEIAKKSVKTSIPKKAAYKKAVRQQRTNKQTAFTYRDKADVKGVVKENNSKAVIKERQADNIVKPKQTSGIVKSRQNIINNSSNTAKPKNKSAINRSYNKAKNISRKKQHNSTDKPYKYKDNTQNDVIVEVNQIKVDVKSRSQNEQISASIKDYINTENSSKPKSKTSVQKLADRKVKEKVLSQKANTANGLKSNTENIKPTVDTVANDKQTYKYVESQQTTAEQPYQYTDNKAAAESIVKSEIASLSDMVKSDNIYSESVKPKTANIKANKNQTAKSNKSSVKNNNNSVSKFAANTAYNNIKQQAENSEDTSIRTTVTAVDVAETAADILKPVSKFTRGDRRSRKINKANVAAAVQRCGIKSEAVNMLKTSVSQANNSAKKAVKQANSAVLSTIKDEISKDSESDLSVKAVDDVINTVETAKNFKQGANTISNTAVNTVKSTQKVVKGAIQLPNEVKNGTQKLQARIRKLQKFRLMSKSRQQQYTKKAAKKTAVKAAQLIAHTVKNVAVQLFGVLFGWIIIIVLIAEIIFAVIGSIIWQTSSDIDTTEIIKYISELDYTQQNKWFSKGKTSIDIAKHNDKSEHQWHYYYILAKDVPPDIETADVDESSLNCVVKIGTNSDGESIKPTYRGFNISFSSSDEMLENYRWTTEDYRAALAYIQVKKNNLGWFSTLFGFVGEMQLKNAAKELHEQTYNCPIVVKNVDGASDTTSYSYEYPIYSTTYSKNDSYYYFFGRKYSVKYLVDNDILRFDDDDIKNKQMKEMFEYTYKYGNLAVGNLSFPLELTGEEKIADRISKHFGKQLVLKYTPPEHPDDEDDVYGRVTATSGYHYANDLSATSGETIFAPISGLCKATQRDERGYEYVISTAYNGTDFDFTKEGYLIKISCSSASYISPSTPKVVKQGDALGKVAGNISANYNKPSKDNDTTNEDIFADKLFPCSTDTAYSEVGVNEFNIPEPRKDHIHIEMYKLPCDFSNEADIEKNVLAPELFFDYSKEE